MTQVNGMFSTHDQGTKPSCNPAHPSVALLTSRTLGDCRQCPARPFRSSRRAAARMEWVKAGPILAKAKNATYPRPHPA